MKFSNQFMQDLVYGDNKETKTISNNIIDTSRWSVHLEIIFQFKEKFYRSYYSHGATEEQYESPYEYDGDEIEVEEVFPVEKTITVYKSAKEMG